MRRLLALVALCGLFAGVAASPVHATQSHRPQPKAGFSVGEVLDVGGVNDKSFNHLAYLGLQQAETQYGVKGTYIVSHSPADYVPNLTHYAQLHVGLVVGVGFLMQSAMYQVAKQFPNQRFAMVDGAPVDAKGNTVILKNVADLFFREQESGYLVGVIAGIMERNKVGRATHNTIGAMGGLSIPPVNRYIAGYIQGAKAVNPHIRVLRGYSQSFTNQGTGKAIGLAQISQGADILFQVAGSSGLGYLAAAQQRGVYGIGVDADQGYLGKFVITSALKKVDVAVRLTVHDAMSGHFKGGDHQFDLRNNATGFAKTSSLVPPLVVRQANTYLTLIKSGKVVPTTVIR